MHIAVVGSGVSGLVSAYLLARRHSVTLFEADDRLGGHVNTIPVERQGGTLQVDAGFIVFNHRNYPLFVRLLEQLNVPSRDSDMSFSVRCERSGLEYCGSSLDGLFAQRSNLLRPSFWKMLRDIVRFNRDARQALQEGPPDVEVGEFLRRGGYGVEMVERYLIPMGAAIWSTSPARMKSFPTPFFLQFLDNHGLIDLTNRPQWKTLVGGSRNYVDALLAATPCEVRLQTPVVGVRRLPAETAAEDVEEQVEIETAGGRKERYDAVVLAVHSVQALRMLRDPSPAETEILSAVAYSRNTAVLHTDLNWLPRSQRAWASWNYHLPEDADGQAAASVTYDMNRLQGLPGDERFLVTLNPHRPIDPKHVIREIAYHHPAFTRASAEAQRRRGEIMHQRRTYFAGAYWGYGFHEDGVRSALDVARCFGLDFESCTVASTKDACGIDASCPDLAHSSTPSI